MDYAAISRPPPPPPPHRRHTVLRRTRFVCVSDTHNIAVKLPKGDVLIHAGDLTNQGSYSELSRAVQWLEKADFETKIVIAGNHDLTLDPVFYAQQGNHFHNQKPQSPRACAALLTGSPTITYLKHESATVRLASPAGPHTCFSVFASPYSPRNGLWAFGYDAPQHGGVGATADLPTLWDDIPLDADVVVTHTPPHTHCDESRVRRAAGCEALRRALWRVRPRLAVCGHVHEGRGVARVRWDLECGNTAFKEEGVEGWDDPGHGNKQSLVNLTAKGGNPLRNDGSHTANSRSPGVGEVAVPGLSAPGKTSESTAQPGLGTRGLGGDPTSPRSDTAVLAGRLGRRETCVVNCAIMAKSYPHVGGKTVNKPIVVDLDLPVWEWTRDGMPRLVYTEDG
ncbi:calcineurin-like phosphoesterase [Colletotrichum graminicola]|uniref:Calcineurin-like phosphoesterase n=1 Tax=Colletotrichum graminicola (strain M1.001 / M2 / FGSC 10212) TaxID=645133 RepID=E3Q4L3_COLGM|nr:calcineurin-like phosphoesterase [Colletotrichum graminicola M1.001]EFQ26028.1 calcineurin-like phosphoesterase [Colletotrichum graminicola M1.001]WDK23161.1 calcineurin-like phosphoesterase [Colletotrichum graminicola]